MALGAVVLAVAVAGALVVTSAAGDESAGGEVTRLRTDAEITAPDIDASDPELAHALGIEFEHFDGHVTRLTEHLGRPVVVNFFSSTCVPCLTEMPELEAVHRELADQVTIVGLNVRDRPADGRRLAEQTGVSYELGFDAEGAIFRAFRAFALPTTVFVDADGTVVEVHTGILYQRDLRDRLEPLVAGG